MKKPLFISISVFVCLAISFCLGYAGYTGYNYMHTMDDFETMEAEKNVTVNDAEAFINDIERVEDITIEKKEYSDYQYVYQRENIHFLSNLDIWNTDLLAELADELYANKHGQEIAYVSTVILNEGTEGDYIGSHESKKESFDIPVMLHGFLPDTMFSARTILSEINLYEADVRTTVEDMAVVLSHEYGHHFTDYYFGITFTEADKDLYYYELRSEGTDNILLSADSFQHYLDNHMWFLNEFAAEDFVFFMGSENAHRIIEFKDSMDRLNIYARYGESALDKLDDAYADCRNGSPHENVSAGLPSDIEGLEEYFYSFIDQEPPVREEKKPIGTLNLSMAKSGSRHTFTWDKPYTSGDIIYTLNIYDENDMLISMLKTAYGDEKAIAYFGYYTTKIVKGNWIYTYSYGADLDRGTKLKARVTITFPDDSILLSEPIDFEY